jgi:hypothetical protein
MVSYSVILKKELDGVERLKELPLLYDILLNPWISFIIHYCIVTYDQPNVTYVLVVRILLKVYMFQLQSPQLLVCVI